MKDFIVVSAHINKLIQYFCQFFDDETLSKAEREQIQQHSNHLHVKLIQEKDLSAYDQHLEFAKSAYGAMLLKINHQQIVEDILFCGESELSWEETSRSLSNLYRMNLNSKELYTFYYLHELNNNFYIDSPLPKR